MRHPTYVWYYRYLTMAYSVVMRSDSLVFFVLASFFFRYNLTSLIPLSFWCPYECVHGWHGPCFMLFERFHVSVASLISVRLGSSVGAIAAIKLLRFMFTDLNKTRFGFNVSRCTVVNYYQCLNVALTVERCKRVSHFNGCAKHFVFDAAK